MIYRPPQEQDFAGMQALELELLTLEDHAFEGLGERERAGRVRTGLAALRFFARSEHSFCALVPGVADEPVPALGYVLAQSVWQGDRPIVWVASLRAHPDAPGATVAGLLHACVKSAYDAAVYEVHLAADSALWPVAEREGFRDSGERHVVRRLGTLGGGPPRND